MNKTKLLYEALKLSKFTMLFKLLNLTKYKNVVSKHLGIQTDVFHIIM